MAWQDPGRQHTTRLGATVTEQTAGRRADASPDQALFDENWKPGWRSWLLVALGVGIAVAVLALLIWLP
jgi:hypothetical protein